MNVCPICEASLSHHTLYTRTCTWEMLSPRIHVQCVIYFHVGPQKMAEKRRKKMCHRTDFEANQ